MTGYETRRRFPRTVGEYTPHNVFVFSQKAPIVDAIKKFECRNVKWRNWCSAFSPETVCFAENKPHESDTNANQRPSKDFHLWDGSGRPPPQTTDLEYAVGAGVVPAAGPRHEQHVEVPQRHPARRGRAARGGGEKELMQPLQVPYVEGGNGGPGWTASSWATISAPWAPPPPPTHRGCTCRATCVLPETRNRDRITAAPPHRTAIPRPNPPPTPIPEGGGWGCPRTMKTAAEGHGRDPPWGPGADEGAVARTSPIWARARASIGGRGWGVGRSIPGWGKQKETKKWKNVAVSWVRCPQQPKRDGFGTVLLISADN